MSIYNMEHDIDSLFLPYFVSITPFSHLVKGWIWNLNDAVCWGRVGAGEAFYCINYYYSSNYAEDEQVYEFFKSGVPMYIFYNRMEYLKQFVV